MILNGLAIVTGLALLFAKLPRRVMLRALHHDLMIDIAVSILVFLLHMGTFSGLMAATVAGLLTSLLTSGLKRLVGHIETNQAGTFYVAGRLNLSV